MTSHHLAMQQQLVVVVGEALHCLYSTAVMYLVEGKEKEVEVEVVVKESVCDVLFYSSAGRVVSIQPHPKEKAVRPPHTHTHTHIRTFYKCV